MPYEIKKDGEQHCVFNQDTGKKVPGGCHDTKEEAGNHMSALYANVEDAGKSQTFTGLSSAIEARTKELSSLKGGPGSGPHAGGGSSKDESKTPLADKAEAATKAASEATQKAETASAAAGSSKEDQQAAGQAHMEAMAAHSAASTAHDAARTEAMNALNTEAYAHHVEQASDHISQSREHINTGAMHYTSAYSKK